MGKSTAAELLAKNGAKVSDSDTLSREFVEPGQPALVEIVDVFGDRVLREDGSLNRSMVGDMVFGDLAAREKLEAVLHPRIREAWQARLDGWAIAGERLAVVVIPLLFETQAESYFDMIVCVACSSKAQQKRLQARGWTDGQIEQRLAAQMEIGEKMKRSDYIVWTDGPIEVQAAQWDALLSSWDGFA